MENLILEAVEVLFMHLVVLVKLIHEANRKKYTYSKEKKEFNWKCYLKGYGLRWFLVYSSAWIAMFFLPAIKDVLIKEGFDKHSETIGFLSIAIASYFGYDMIRIFDKIGLTWIRKGK